MDNEKQLTDEAKSAINKHIIKWVAIFGVSNLSALVIAFCYIFLVLPDRAVNEARNKIESEAIEQTNKLRFFGLEST